jgi:hypothetical protein
VFVIKVDLVGVVGCAEIVGGSLGVMGGRNP